MSYCGERVRVRGIAVLATLTDCPSPQSSPRANAMILLVNIGVEREPFEVGFSVLLAQKLLETACRDQFPLHARKYQLKQGVTAGRGLG